MDPSTVVAVLSALGAGLILRRIVDHLLNRGKVRIDEAAKIREELRNEIRRKNKEIEHLGERITALEAELEKAEDERALARDKFRTYKLDVWQALVQLNADRAVLDAILAIQ
jgi:predicted nuclease with TOPRIM domain